MANISKITVDWQVPSGGSGSNTFYALDGPGVESGLETAYNSIKSYVPVGVTWGLHRGGEILDPLNGTLVGDWGTSVVAGSSPTGTGVWANGVGLSLRWETGTIMDGHRLRGRTYIVPIVSSAFGPDGNILASVETAFNTAFQQVITSHPGQLVVWHRPKDPRAGGFSVATTVAVRPKPAILRTRRD
jgi:hypothetical protein